MTALMGHQVLGIQKIDAAEREGHRAICVTSPTGAGKTLMMSVRSKLKADAGGRVGILTDRKLLLNQARSELHGQDVLPGYVAASYGMIMDRRVTLLSKQTVHRRCMQGAPDQWVLPPLNYLEVDEAHGAASGVAEQLIGHYLRHGTTVVGWTASPVGLAHIYTKLITAGTKAELRQKGLLVPCHVYAPDEPSLDGISKRADGEFVQTQAAKRIMQTIVVGNVFKEWDRLNPDHRPTMLWAPGLAESRWFVQQWDRRGVTAAHVDGGTSDAERDDIFGASKDGRLKVISSFGVLREGANMPWMYHGILVQACGAVATFLQLVGRLLRAAPDKDHCVLQDHSGAWWRHGSPNLDRDWQLGDTNRSIADARAYAFLHGTEREPMRCCNCNGIRAYSDKSGPCPHCGWVYRQSVRMVRMADGSLMRMTGTVHKRKDVGDEDRRVWRKCLYAACYCQVPRTLNQAAADFKRRTGRSLPADMPYLPDPGSIDWARPVPSVYPDFARRRRRDDG